MWGGSDRRIPRFSGISGLNVELQANERLCAAKVPSPGEQYIPNLHGSNTTAHGERETKQFIRLTYRAMGEGFPGRRMGDFVHPRRSAASRDGGFLMAARTGRDGTGALLYLYHLSPPRGPEATCNYGRLASNTLDGVVSYSGSHDLPTRMKGQRSASPAEVMVGEQAQLDFRRWLQLASEDSSVQHLVSKVYRGQHFRLRSPPTHPSTYVHLHIHEHALSLPHKSRKTVSANE